MDHPRPWRVEEITQHGIGAIVPNIVGLIKRKRLECGWNLVRMSKKNWQKIAMNIVAV